MSSIRGRIASAVAVLAIGLLAGAGNAPAQPTYRPDLAHQQAAPIALTTESGARGPNVAVDADGTGWFSWVVIDGSTQKAVVCKVPRGATACALTKTFQPADGLNQFTARVLVASPGHVVFLYQRCCTTIPSAHTTVVESTDNGVTWSAPLDVGTLEPDAAVLGPGPYLISATETSSSVGAGYQAFDRRGPKTSTVAYLGDVLQGQWYEAGTGFVDPTTPIAAFTDLASTFYRVFNPTEGTNYNSAANWGPTHAIAGAADARLASGPSGTALLTRSGEVSARHFDVRTLDRQALTFGAPTVVSETGDISDGWLNQDAAGGLQAVWIDNDVTLHPEAVGAYPLRSAYSPNGQSWTERRTVMDSTQGFTASHVRVAAAPDGGGFAVMDDNDGAGTIRAAVLPPAGSAGVDPPPSPPPGGGGDGGGGTPPPGPPVTPPAPNCTYLLKASANVQARASGCFTKVDADHWSTKADVRLNGIDLLTGGQGKIVVDTEKHTVTTDAKVQQRAGAIVLHKGAQTWKLTGTTSFTGLSGTKVLGFPVEGNASVDFAAGAAANVQLTLALPSPFDNVTSATVLRTTTTEGLHLDGLKLDVASAFVGPLVVKELHVAYVASAATFEGTAQFVLPPSADDAVGVDFGFQDGQFTHAGVHHFTGPPLPIVLSPPGLLLNSLGFEVSIKDGFMLTGEAGIGAGPEVGGVSAIGIDGAFTFAIPKSADYATLTIGGTLKVIGLKLASATATFDTRGTFTFDGGIDFTALEPVLGAHAAVHGEVDVTAPSFLVNGEVKLCAPSDCQDVLGVAHLEAGAALLVSSKGFGACGNALGASFGVIEVFGSGPDAYLDDCESDGFDKIGVHAARAHAAQAPGASTFTVKPGERQVDVRVLGTGGIPAVTLTGPDGRTVGSLPGHPEAFNQDGRGGLVFPAPARADRPPSTTFLIAKPAPGTWTITPQEGSVPIADVALARALPAARSTASLHRTGKGRGYVLTYKNANLAGRTVTYAERGAGGVVHPLGSTRRSAGTLRFAASDGPGGRRTIFATLVNRDIPVRQTTVATFTAPAPIVPRRAPRLRIARAGTRAIVTWSSAVGAADYRVQLTVSDGRRLQVPVTGRHRRVTVPAVGRTTRITASVVGRSARGRSGPRATARLSAVKAKKKVTKRAKRR